MKLKGYLADRLKEAGHLDVVERIINRVELKNYTRAQVWHAVEDNPPIPFKGGLGYRNVIGFMNYIDDTIKEFKALDKTNPLKDIINTLSRAKYPELVYVGRDYSKYRG